MNKGVIHQIIGPVIDVKFNPDEMPELNRYKNSNNKNQNKKNSQ